MVGFVAKLANRSLIGLVVAVVAIPGGSLPLIAGQKRRLAAVGSAPQEAG
jgi:hypothetical protein